MRVWIDLANSPHPILFAPIADALEADGHELVVTTRDHAQTLALTRKRWPTAEVVGARSPDGLIAKAGAVVGRARGLAQFARRTRPDLAVSHNSYAQTMAARVVGVPCVTGMDYEYQPANHVAFRCAQRVIVPTVFPEAALRRQGAGHDKVWRYDGYKEEIYLHRLEPDPAVLRPLGLREGEPFVVARPSPRGATYHRQENPLFDRAVRAVLTRTDAKVVLIARREEDLTPYRASFGDRVVRPTGPVDGPSLLYFACALLGAGGTMNREAALLGTPVVSLYAGALGAADRSLVRQGRVLSRRATRTSLPGSSSESLRVTDATAGLSSTPASSTGSWPGSSNPSGAPAWRRASARLQRLARSPRHRALRSHRRSNASVERTPHGVGRARRTEVVRSPLTAARGHDPQVTAGSSMASNDPRGARHSASRRHPDAGGGGPCYAARASPPGQHALEVVREWDHRRYSGDDDPFLCVDLAPLVSGIATLTLRPGGRPGAHGFDAATATAVAAADLDVLIDFGLGDLPDEVVRSARYGIWSLHHGHEGSAREFPPLFREISARAETAMTSLQALAADGPRVIFRSHGSTNIHSLYLTRKANYWKTATFIPRCLKHLHELGWEHLTSLDPGEPAASHGAGRRSPGNVEMAAFLVRLGGRLALRRVRSRAVEDAWFIAYRPRRTGTGTDGIPRDMTGFREILAPPGGQFADPFVFEHGGRHYIFFEQLRRKSDKGVISYVELDHAGRCSAPQLALEREYHLSYPYLFVLDGEVFMVPETSARRTVELYRAQPFPSRWHLESVAAGGQGRGGPDPRAPRGAVLDVRHRAGPRRNHP